MNKFIELFIKEKLICISGIIEILLFIAGMILHNIYLAVYGFVLIANFADLLGYKIMLKQGEVEDIELAAYRVIMAILNWGFILWFYFYFGLAAAIALIIIEFGAVKDIIYYIIGEYGFPEKWTWLKWSFLGWFKGENINNNAAILQAGASLIISILILIFI